MVHRRVSSAFVVCGMVMAASACHERAQSVATDATPGVVNQAPPATDAQRDAGRKSRCSLATDRAAINLQLGDGAVLGEAVPFAGGLAVGILRSHEGGRLASVVRLDANAAAPVDLGPSWGDAPPPQPVVRAGELYAVTYVRPDARPSPSRATGTHPTGRALSVHHVGVTIERLVQLPSETDTSSAYDVIAATTLRVAHWSARGVGRHRPRSTLRARRRRLLAQPALRRRPARRALARSSRDPDRPHRAHDGRRRSRRCGRGRSAPRGARRRLLAHVDFPAAGAPRRPAASAGR